MLGRGPSASFSPTVLTRNSSQRAGWEAGSSAYHIDGDGSMMLCLLVSAHVMLLFGVCCV